MSDGHFRLLDLPREIRDRIYTYALAHSGLKLYNTPDHPYYHSSRPIDISLLLINHQIHREASPLLISTNCVRIGTVFEEKELKNSIRIFPANHWGNVRDIKVVYLYRSPRLGPVSAKSRKVIDQRPRPDPSGLWANIVSDAHLVKDFFPTLQRFTAWWTLRYKDGAIFLGRYTRNGSPDHSDAVERILEWLRESYELDQRKPPRWLRVWWPREVNQQAWDEALETFKMEVGTAQDDDLESSGSKWIEDFWEAEDKKKGRKGKSKKLEG